MAMKSLRILFCLVLLGWTLPSGALEISTWGGLLYAAPSESIQGVDQGWTGSAGYAFGINALLPLWESSFSLESGVSLLKEASERSVSGLSSTRKTEWIQVPLLLHYHFDSSMSLGAGGYAGFAQGMVSTTDAVSTVNQPYDTAQMQTLDLGLLIDLRARFRLSESLSLILDARYQHGFQDLSTVTTKSLFARSIHMLGGISYRFD
jgi:hypothetical protein